MFGMAFGCSERKAEVIPNRPLNAPFGNDFARAISYAELRTLSVTNCKVVCVPLVNVLFRFSSREINLSIFQNVDF